MWNGAGSSTQPVVAPSHLVDAVLLGMPVHFACSCNEVAAAVREACGAWSGPVDRSAEPLVIKLHQGARSVSPEPPDIRVVEARMTLSGGGVEGLADAAWGTATCTLSPAFLASPATLLVHVLEPLGLFLATRNDRVPIHASGVQLDDLAILFAGKSGAGKSSLALAAAGAGLAVIAEDTVYVQQEPRFAVWGWRGPVHLLARDAGKRAGAPRLRNGRLKFAVDLGGSAAAPQPATAATLCVLRHGERASLAPISQERALGMLGPPEAGFDLLQAEIAAVLARLTRNGAWLLTLSNSPCDAAALIGQEAATLRTRGSS